MVIKEMIHQGDIIKIENIKTSVLVVSKDYFNETGEIIGCPLYEKGKAGPLHIYVCGDEIKGYAQCEKIQLFDMNIRRFRKVDNLHISDIMNVSDAIQGIFDYV